ncbi:hypothetical protein ACFRCW_35795 [Streptomyces sp. NPDC056653]|uniref:hypothetical protein n=1 Tax=Streptomyces sp. NPDC056653 TaxID=3345894 RepID=UPI00368EB1C9
MILQPGSRGKDRTDSQKYPRLLGTLIEEGYVAPEGGGSYGVGPQLRSMAAQILSDDTVGIGSTLRALQQRLGQAVHLAVLGGDAAEVARRL